MKTSLKLKNCEVEVDGAEGIGVWFMGDDDQWVKIMIDEIPDVIKFLQNLESRKK